MLINISAIESRFYCELKNNPKSELMNIYSNLERLHLGLTRTTSLIGKEFPLVQFESAIDCITHPIDFEDFYEELFYPLLQEIGISDIKVSSTFVDQGGSEFEYVIKFENSNSIMELIIESDSDYFEACRSILNLMLVEGSSNYYLFNLDQYATTVLTESEFNFINKKKDDILLSFF